MAIKKLADGTPAIEALIGLGEVAKLTGYSTVWILKIVKQGYIPKSESGKYRIIDVVQGTIKFLTEAKKLVTKTVAASRVQEARANQIELSTSREAGELMEVNEALLLVDRVVGGLKVELVGLPTSFTRDRAERFKLNEMLDGILTRCADRLERETGTLKTEGKLSEDEVADDS